MGFSSGFHVAAGSYEIGMTQPRRLQAFLGTCVGVAAFDRVAGVGGLLHLLLPEPVNPRSVDSPEKYATTAMPKFLERLEALGATRANLTAVVAGGALVGPVSRQDMQLDIGGRTTEIALEILDRMAISVDRSETGGFFTCCLELDMQRWTCTIEPAGFEYAGGHRVGSLPTAADIEQAIAAVRPIPQVALKVLRIVEDADYSISRVADIVRKDQVISARTIQLCNSAMFTKRHEVASLDHALVYLGRELFLKLVISAAVQSYFDQVGMGYSLCKGGLYHHAVGTAMVAETIAGVSGVAAAGTAYTAGLLHDIGKVVLDQYIAGAYPILYREIQLREDIMDAENRILGVDHTRVGERLARSWALPQRLIRVIRDHHRPAAEQEDEVLTAVVSLADLLMSRLRCDLERERIGAGDLADQLVRIGLNAGQFQELIDRIPDHVFSAVGAAPQPDR